MRRRVMLVFGVMAVAGPAMAQVPSTISCSDRDGRAVTGVPVTTGVLAKATTDATGRHVIEYDARRVAGITPQLHLFVYAHECGHHALGHDLNGRPITPAQEHDADCYGIRALMNRAGVTSDDVRKLQEDTEALGAGDARRLPWQKRAYDLVGCLPRDDTADADTRPPSVADECLGHQDAANQIIRKSRDGRSITAVYAASNRCARDLACTFVIEIGTLPDADADAGSFARFRAQKTRSEPHALKAGSSAEFRFQEMIDTVPAGESVDFRVTAECR